MGCTSGCCVRGRPELGTMCAVFREAAIKALCQRGRCGRVRVLAVTLWVREMLRGMLHGCAEMLGGSGKMQSWEDKIGGR